MYNKKNSNSHLVFLGQLHDLQSQQKEKKMLCNKFFLCHLQKRGKTCATFYTQHNFHSTTAAPAPATPRTLHGLIWDKVISGIQFSFSHHQQQQQHCFVITAHRRPAVENDMKLVF